MSDDLGMRHGRSSGNDAAALSPPLKKPCYGANEAVVTTTSIYDEVVKSAAFVDKTLHIRSIFSSDSLADTVLFSAPFRCGKSTNMNMVKQFLSQEVDESGKPTINVIWSEQTGWEEQPQQSKSFNLFKTLQIYKCHHHKKTSASGQCQPIHTEDDCKRERCEPNHDCKLGQCKPDHDEDECRRGDCEHRNFFYGHCGKHPVVFLNLQTVTFQNLEELRGALKKCLQKAFLEHKYLLESSVLADEDKETICDYIYRMRHGNLEPQDVLDGLQWLVTFLVEHFKKVDSQQETTQKVFVLVEEYDAPISLLLQEKAASEDYMTKVMWEIGSMVSCVLKGNENVLGGIVNACRDVKGALSNYANNVSSVAFLEDVTFYDYCGFTAVEIDRLLLKEEFKGVNRRLLDDYYNGYHQLDNPNRKVYITYSIVNHFKEWVKLQKASNRSVEAAQPKHYYVERGVVKLEEMLAIDSIREQILDMIQGNDVTVNDVADKLGVHDLFLLKELLNNPSGDVEEDSIELFFHYLKHHGYIFGKKRENEQLVLSIPNQEIVSLFKKKLWLSSYYKNKYHVQSSAYVNALLGLKVGEDVAKEKVEMLAEAITNMFPTAVFPQRHDELKGILFTYAFTSKRFAELESEPYVVEGRKFQCDLAVLRKDKVGIILEIASGGKTEREALKQIFERYYCKKLDQEECDGKIYIGLSYDYSKGGTKICAYATDGKTVTSRCPKEKDCIFVSVEC